MASNTNESLVINFLFKNNIKGSELEDLLQANRLYKFSYETEDFIKKISGREADSYTIRETGKFISDLVNEIKLKYEVKE